MKSILKHYWPDLVGGFVCLFIIFHVWVVMALVWIRAKLKGRQAEPGRENE